MNCVKKYLPTAVWVLIISIIMVMSMTMTVTAAIDASGLKDCGVTFDFGNGETLYEVVPYGKFLSNLPDYPADLLGAGESFLGWYSGGTKYTTEVKITRDVTLTPKIERPAPPPKVYTVSFWNLESQVGSDYSITEGESFRSSGKTFPTVPAAISGAKQRGWGEFSVNSNGRLTKGFSEFTIDDRIYGNRDIEYLQYYTLIFKNGTQIRDTWEVQAGYSGGGGLGLPSTPLGEVTNTIKDETNEITFEQRKMFGGWFSNQDGTGNQFTGEETAAHISGDKVWYAKWEAPPTETYTVTFEMAGVEEINGNPVTEDIVIENVAKDAVVLVLPKATAEGKDPCNRWKIKDTDTEWIADSTKVTEEVTLVPMFKVTDYTVKYQYRDNAGSGKNVQESRNISHGALVTYIPTVETVTENGFAEIEEGRFIECTITFVPTGRWIKEDLDTIWDFYADRVTSNMTLRAEYEMVFKDMAGNEFEPILDPNCKLEFASVTFKYNLAGYTDKRITVIKDTMLSEAQIPKPTRPKNTFQYWAIGSISGTKLGTHTVISSDITVYPVWKADITIVFNSDGGSFVSTETIPYGSKLNPPGRKPEKKYHTFLGWSRERQKTSPAEDFAPVDFDTAEFVSNETLWGWYESNTIVNFHYETPEAGEQVVRKTIYEGYSMRVLEHAPEDPAMLGGNRVFAGWYTQSGDDGEQVSKTFITGPGKTLDVYAHWKPGFSVTFMPQTETARSRMASYAEGDKVVEYYAQGESVAPPDLGVINGKHVVGWYLDSLYKNPADFVTIARNTTVYAKWEAIPAGAEVTITYDVQEGEFAGGTGKTKEFRVTMGEAVADKRPGAGTFGLPNMFFGQWYFDVDCTQYADLTTLKPSRDTTLYARWMCKIDFAPVYGGSVPPVLVKKGDTIPKPVNPNDTNRYFEGWSKNDAAADSEELWVFWEDTADRNSTLYGVWGSQVDFNPVGGSFVSEQPDVFVFEKAADKTIEAPAEEPQKQWSDFDGWYKDAEYTQPFAFRGNEGTVDVVAQNTTLYAKWIPWELSGGYKLSAEVLQGGSCDFTPVLQEASGNRNYVGYFDEGDTVKLTATADSGYAFESITVNDGTAREIFDAEVTFEMPTSPVAITVKFRKNEATSSNSGGGGKTRGTSTNTAPSNPVITYFDDIDMHWAEQNINSLAEQKLVNGIDYRIFAPEDQMTRGMFITILARMSGENLSGYENKYIDVLEDSWYRNPTAWARDRGLISSTEDGRLEPEAYIIRQDMALLLDRYMKYKQQYFGEVANAAANTRLNDISDVAPYAKEAVVNMEALDIITGKPGMKDGQSVTYYDPNKTATRAEVSTMFFKYLIRVR